MADQNSTQHSLKKDKYVGARGGNSHFLDLFVVSAISISPSIKRWAWSVTSNVSRPDLCATGARALAVKDQ